MTCYRNRSLGGFSLVEMMVGVVISMLAILVIFEAFAVFEGQKRTTTSATAAQESGLLALSAIDRDARMAGYGMVVNNMLACASVNVFQSGAVSTIPFLPIAITDGGGTANDSITVMYSTSPFAPTPAVLSVDSP
ncbi:MAG: prepilin-type N-terminal cleavage/methylation domain-containing protein, partial [Betaproteobacteria bacterium]